MNEFHIINVGASIITNYQKTRDDLKNRKLADNQFWGEILATPRELKEIYEFVKNNPYQNSAELNSFLRKIKNTKNRIEVYFTGTKTPVNEICVRALERFMRDNSFTVYTTKEFPGYFMETYEGEDRVKSFSAGIVDMLNHLIRLAKAKRQAGYRVFFNPTGGFKAHVIACALAGFMTGAEVYYLNEEFNDVVTLPPLFYIPRGQERELLNLLADGQPRSGKECETIFNTYGDSVERLITYNLIDAETDDTGAIFRIKITSRGRLINQELRAEQ
jgi:putative CRISPR-associated protein (TIGR02619 family)